MSVSSECIGSERTVEQIYKIATDAVLVYVKAWHHVARGKARCFRDTSVFVHDCLCKGSRCEAAVMAGRKVVQDSDDESNEGGSPLPPEDEPLQLSLDTIIDLPSSNPSKIMQQFEQPSTGSTGPSTVEIMALKLTPASRSS